ncbi:hypothetical protein AB0O76_28835 [Streptomyces sp. NPDC086554]|uniref:hypothetical protein n=1 Tax=Streptomyces sp. NPDC086554 TaxID=3154864 RepID=UPI00343776C4
MRGLLGQTRLPTQAGKSRIAELVEYVADRQLLITLDTCEHLVDACALLLADRPPGCRAARCAQGRRHRAALISGGVDAPFDLLDQQRALGNPLVGPQ